MGDRECKVPFCKRIRWRMFDYCKRHFDERQLVDMLGQDFKEYLERWYG